MKKFHKILVIIIIVLVVLAFLKDQIIKSVITSVSTDITGTKVQIAGFSLGIIKQSVRITGFKMYNPEGFPGGVIIDLPKVSVDCDLFSLLKGKLHLRLLEIELKEIGLERNKQGKLNVDSLKLIEQKQGKPLTMQIDMFNLGIGRIVYKDYSVGIEPKIQVYDINLKKSYKNITSAQQLAALILAEPMKQAGIKGAAIYGAALLTGVGIIPVAIVAVFSEKDNVQRDIKVPLNKFYDISLVVLRRIGKINKEDRAGGVISANVNGASVTLRLKQQSSKATGVTISARKNMLPKPEIASGVLYQIMEEVNK